MKLKARIIILFTILLTSLVWSLSWDDFRENAYFVSEGPHFGHWRGFVIQGQFAYAISDYGLEIVDISDPAEPCRISFTSTPTYTYCLTIEGDYAYIGGVGLWVVDIHDPYNPVLIGNLPTRAYVKWILLEDNLTYMADGGLTIASVENPFQPELICTSDYEIRNAFGLAKKDKHVFVTGYNGLYTFNVESIDNPELIDHIESDGSSGPVFLSDSLLFACFEDSTPVYNCQNSPDLELVTNFALEGVLSILQKDSYLFINNISPWISIYDINDLDAHNRVSRLETNDDDFYRPEIWGYDVSDTIIICGEYEYGYEIFNISDIQHPDSIGGEFPIAPHSCSSLAKDGDFIYLTRITEGIEVYSVEDIGNPVMTDAVENIASRGYNIIRVNNGYAYVVDYSDERYRRHDREGGPTGERVKIFDVHDPYNIDYITEFIPPNFSFLPELEINNDIFFLGVPTYTPPHGDRIGAVFVYDLDNPVEPELLSIIPLDRLMGSIAVDEQYLYTLDRERMCIFDKSDPADISLVGELESPGDNTDSMNSMAVNGERAYFALHLDVYVVNIEDHQNPSYSYHFESSSAVIDVFIDNDILYLSHGRSGFEFYSLENPDRPRKIGFYDTPGFVADMYVDDGIAYIADYFNFGIYSIGDTLISDASEFLPTQPPTKFKLYPAIPNPFNSTTTIGYSLPVAGNVSLTVYDLSGREVVRLVDGVKPAGTHEAVWVADGMSSGVYVVKISDNQQTTSQKIILMR